MAPRAIPGDIRKLPSGRLQARYTWPDRVRRPAPSTFITRADAAHWLAATHTDVGRAGSDWLKLLEKPKPGLTLDEYAAGWLERREVNGAPLAEWTKSRYASLLRRHISPTFGSLPITSITPEAVMQWYGALLKDRRTTRAHCYGLLRTLLRSAVRERLIAESPCMIGGAGSVKRAHDVRIASMDELALIVENLPGRLRLAALLAVWCSLRYGEVFELRRSDVVIEKNGSLAVHVRRGVTWPTSASTPLVGPPKTRAGVRTVAVPPHLVPVVKAHLADHAAWGRDGLLFQSARGDQIHPAAFHKHWARARAAAGRTDLRFHDLRHTGATLAAQAGATISELMRRLGHTTPAAAMVYQHASSERDAEIAARLSAMAQRKT